MERIDFNQGRIAWCCEDSGITLSDLALETGVSEAALDKAVSGERGLTFNQLKKIADYFGRGVLFSWSQARPTLQRSTRPLSGVLPIKSQASRPNYEF